VAAEVAALALKNWRRLADAPRMNTPMAVLRSIVALWSKPTARPAGLDPTLPATAQIVAVQHPSATLPERPYDLVLLAAVLALLGIGTIEIYAATAADGLTRFHDAAHFLERQILFRRVDEAIFTDPRKDAETDAWYQNPDQRTAFSPENFMELSDAE